MCSGGLGFGAAVAMSLDMPMSLADMWNRQLTKRGAADDDEAMPQAGANVKRCKSSEMDSVMSEHAMLEQELAEMSDDGVDAALEELLQEETEHKGRPPSRGNLCGLSSMNCCVAPRKAPARAAPAPAPVRKANLPVPAPNGAPNGIKVPPNGAPDLNGQKNASVDQSPNSVMRMLYPNLFH